MGVVVYTIFLFLINNCVDCSNGITRRIVGGSDAEDAAYPYLVSVQYNRNHICGGSILNNRWILTAAHCTIGVHPRQLSVVAGTNSLDGSGQRYKVDKYINHAGFYFNEVFVCNDICLMKLTQNISFSDRVKTIKVPEEDTPSGRKLKLAGWGKLTFPGEVSKTLKAINLTSITNAECSRYHYISSSNLCTRGDRGRGACEDDSGGPLVDGHFQVGIVSYGTPCAIGRPDVFTRVYRYRSWIRSNMV